MRVKERYELAAEMSERYRVASKAQRGALLNAFCLATGYERKHAIKVWGAGAGSRRSAWCAAAAAAMGWSSSSAEGGLGSRRLSLCGAAQPFLPDLLPLLKRHGHLEPDVQTESLLLRASTSTVERNLAQLRRGLLARKMSQTKPGSLLRRQVPVVVGKWKQLDQAGYLEIDLVSRSGEIAVGNGSGRSPPPTSAGWTERVPIMGRGQTTVLEALRRVRQQLPFPPLGLHPDNGSEFLNWHLVTYCQGDRAEGRPPLLLSRSRPERKNDNAHVEQKNWTLVRRLIGYQRLDTASQLEWLDRLYTELLRPYNNCFQPTLKLIGKRQVGERTRKLYDRPRTPLQRVLDSGAADPTKIPTLVHLYAAVSPLTLKRQIDRRLAAMPIVIGEAAGA